MEVIGYVYGAEDKRALLKNNKKKSVGQVCIFRQTVGFNMDTVADPSTTSFDTLISRKSHTRCET
jgi:hypothetical protein